MTPKQLRALTIVRDAPGIRPAAFGQFMWPDNPGHKRRGKCGPYAVTPGVGMNLAAGAFLGRLRRAGLLRSTEEGHEITDEGVAALEAAGLSSEPQGDPDWHDTPRPLDNEQQEEPSCPK